MHTFELGGETVTGRITTFIKMKDTILFYNENHMALDDYIEGHVVDPVKWDITQTLSGRCLCYIKICLEPMRVTLGYGKNTAQHYVTHRTPTDEVIRHGLYIPEIVLDRSFLSKEDFIPYQYIFDSVLKVAKEAEVWQ